MPFEKTTFLPPGDPELARELLNELIHEELKVLMLVLGSSDDARILAERGNKSAGAINEPFWSCGYALLRLSTTCSRDSRTCAGSWSRALLELC